MQWNQWYSKRGSCHYIYANGSWSCNSNACVRELVQFILFCGISAKALADRINDCQAKMILTSDGNFRGKKQIPVKDVVDEAISKSDSVEKVVVLKRTEMKVKMYSGRDFWWDKFIEGQSEQNNAVEVDAEDLLFILYTSGSTGKPKGVVHSTAGYMIYTYYSFINVFQYQENDIYWIVLPILDGLRVTPILWTL